MSHIDYFTRVYENCVWGDNKNKNYNGSSGWGSNPELNKVEYIPFVKKFITDNSINTVIDLGCGDFLSGKDLYDNLNITYHGYDAYKKIIDSHKLEFNDKKYNFTHLDFFNQPEHIIDGDLCILKDVLQHWKISEIYSFLDFIIEKRKFKFILIVNCRAQIIENQDVTDVGTGFRGLTANMLPLKKYNPQIMLNYGTKELSVIKL